MLKINSSSFSPALLALALLLALIAAANAQSAVKPAPAVAAPNVSAPTAQQIQQSLSDLLLCRGTYFGGNADQKKFQQMVSVMTYLQAQRRALKKTGAEGLANALDESQEDSVLVGDFALLGTRFQTISLLGWDGGGGGAGAIGYSRSGTTAIVLAALRKQGLAFKPSAPGDKFADGELVLPMQGWMHERISLASHIKIALVNRSPKELGKATTTEGLSLFCTVSPTAEATAQRVFGTPSLATLQRMVYANKAEPRAWVDNLLAKPHPEIWALLATYAHLQPDQAALLFAKRNATVNNALAANASLMLSDAQVDSLVAQGGFNVWQSLVTQRFSQLTPAHKRKIGTAPQLRNTMIYRAGGPAAFELLSDTFSRGNAAESTAALYNVAKTPEVVDLVLARAPLDTRINLAMDSTTIYSHAQVDRMLQDATPNIIIGVLRRKDVPITAAQYTRGLRHPNKDVQFWYRTRTEQTPSSAELEAGLTSTDTPTRRGWLNDKRLMLNQAQTDRAFQDRGTRVAVLGREDASVSAAQFDACTNDSDVSVRFACVSRADYIMTQSRFQDIVSDWNANVLRFYLGRKGQAAQDLTPFAIEAMKTAPPEVQLAMAEKRDLPLSDDVIAIGVSSADPRVKQAFCRRSAKGC